MKENVIGFSLLNECSKYTTPSREENIDLVIKAQNGDKEAISELCVKNGKFISYIINKNFASVEQTEDIFQQGMMGLLIAIKKFDASKGYSFSTYAYNWINQQMSRYLQDTGRPIRIPVHLYPQISKMNRLRMEYLNTYGEYPCDEWLAKKMNLSLEKIKNLSRYTDTVLSLDESYATDKDDNFTLADTVADTTIHIEDDVLNEELNKDLKSCMEKRLTEREMKVMVMRYGLNGGIPKTLEEVGKKLGVTRERVRQIEAKSLSKLKVYNVKRKLQDYLFT